MESVNLAKYRQMYSDTLSRLEVAQLVSGPDITVGGVAVNRMAYLRELRELLEWLRKIPGVDPTSNPSFQFEEYL